MSNLLDKRLVLRVLYLCIISQQYIIQTLLAMVGSNAYARTCAVSAETVTRNAQKTLQQLMGQAGYSAEDINK